MLSLSDESNIYKVWSSDWYNENKFPSLENFIMAFLQFGNSIESITTVW